MYAINPDEPSLGATTCSLGLVLGGTLFGLTAATGRDNVEVVRRWDDVWVPLNGIVAAGALYAIATRDRGDTDGRERIVVAGLTASWVGTAAWVIAGAAEPGERIRLSSVPALTVGAVGIAAGALSGYIVGDSHERRRFLGISQVISLQAAVVLPLLWLVDSSQDRGAEMAATGAGILVAGTVVGLVGAVAIDDETSGATARQARRSKRISLPLLSFTF